MITSFRIKFKNQFHNSYLLIFFISIKIIQIIQIICGKILWFKNKTQKNLTLSSISVASKVLFTTYARCPFKSDKKQVSPANSSEKKSVYRPIQLYKSWTLLTFLIHIILVILSLIFNWIKNDIGKKKKSVFYLELNNSPNYTEKVKLTKSHLLALS